LGGGALSGALVAGLDRQSAALIDKKPWFGPELDGRIASGAIPADAVTTATRRVLRTMFAHGVVGVDWSQRQAIDYAAHGEVARGAAASIVLLKNEG
jgi:beta-glucosidase